MNLFNPIEYTTQRVNPNVSCGLWVIKMCQCNFIDYNRCTTLVVNVGNGGGHECVGVGKSFYLLLSFAMNLKLL